MIVKEIMVRKRESYEEGTGTYKAHLRAEGDDGKIELTLSPGSIRKILEVVKQDASVRAQVMASKVGDAVDDASNELVLSHETNLLEGPFGELD